MRPERFRLGIAVAVMVGLCGTNAMAQGSIVVGDEFPVKDESVRIHVTDDAGNPVQGASVEVTYRPGSSVEKIDSIGTSAADGALRWTPVEAGIAMITATWSVPGEAPQTSSTSVSVRFRSPPIGGIVIMVAAGILLVIGSAVRVFNLLRTPHAP